MINRTIWVLGLLLVCAMVINWYQDRVEQDRETPAVAVSEPDLFMVNALISQYDDGGQLRHQIRTARLTHYTVTDATELQAPHITLYPSSGSPWQIDSGAGRMAGVPEGGQEALELWEDVTLERKRDDGQFISIATERLTVVPEARSAHTDERVSIETNQGTIAAAGMRAQLDPGHFTFLSDSEQRVSTVLSRR